MVLLAASIGALAEAGCHAVAPDQRGYGQTDRPEAVEEKKAEAMARDNLELSPADCIHALLRRAIAAWRQEQGQDQRTEAQLRGGRK